MKSKKQFKALLIGKSFELTTAPLPLLKRANFDVDLIAFFGISSRDSSFRSIYCINSIGRLAEILPGLLSQSNYDLVVVGDDETLSDIHGSNLSAELKMQILPISSINGECHLYSKIGLSTLLQKSGITTPRFEVAKNEAELLSLAEKVGYPVIVKIDYSGGGAGVFQCNSMEEIFTHLKSCKYPLLVQQFIEGDMLDLSAFYQNGQLIHFTYSKFEKTVGGSFGPSSVRSYQQLAIVNREVFEELRRLGMALSAHGFVNISVMHSIKDGKRYYFEADMRPNVWVDYGKYIGNDAAIAISEYFTNGQTLNCPPVRNPQYPQTLLIPYILRLSFWELLLNKYKCWDYIEGWSQLFLQIPSRIDSVFTALSIRFIKPRVSSSVWSKLKYLHSQVVMGMYSKLR
ncbi:ATP-grasp domain-containing protein [Polynucleobacter sp. MG-28-Ekke-A2]|uniref:ATP-grasp domain-containing protein n=1 Tax=Polynucleobacter sp. MG-28-Ekke-A2 TaxID=3108276 RepID=UPI002B23A409|nr:ATP-grasp domain-containing protein [Polynucleobacter sp. MG-28-Ekke-A2]MEA9602773.1 ATP-grasp domain-containing protein [Polynucleobacter sp. MG-28-Ekke-A2]